MKKLFIIGLFILSLFLIACRNKDVANNEETGIQVNESSNVDTIIQETTGDIVENSTITENNTVQEPIELTVYSQLSSYAGEQKGWFAKVMLDKFNVRLNIVWDSDGTFDARMKSKIWQIS